MVEIKFEKDLTQHTSAQMQGVDTTNSDLCQTYLRSRLHGNKHDT